MVLGTEQKESTSLFCEMKEERINAILILMDCNQTLMGVQPVMSAVFISQG
jgi:hypothetical protein